MPTTARLVVCSALLTLLLTPAIAAADPRADARAKLVQGGDLLKHGRFEEALTRFQEAYKLVPSPKIQYNFGLAYRGMGRKADALEAFERFLAEAPDASKETRQTAEQERAQLLGQVAVLEVKVDLSGAEIFVDGRSYGTNHTGSIYLDPGPHHLSVEKQGETAYTERINALAGQRMTVMARLVRSPSAEPPPPKESPRLAETGPPQAPPSGGRDVPPGRDSPPQWQPIAAWTAAGAAVLVAGFSTYELMSSNSKFDDFNHRGECGSAKGDRGGPACATLYDDATSARQKAYVGYAVAGAFAAASVVFFVLTPEKPASGSVSLGCAPSLLRPGLACAARF